MLVCDQPTTINKINRNHNQSLTLTSNSNATTNQRVSRPRGVDAMEGGAAGGTCSSPGGRSSASVGQQRESSVGRYMTVIIRSTGTIYCLSSPPVNQWANQNWISLRNAGKCQVLSAACPTDTNQVFTKSINSLRTLHWYLQ